MSERYEFDSRGDGYKVSQLLEIGMKTGDESYDTYFASSFEGGERLYLTEDDQTKIVMDDLQTSFFIASRKDNEQTRKIRDNLVKLLTEYAKVSIRKAK